MKKTQRGKEKFERRLGTEDFAAIAQSCTEKELRKPAIVLANSRRIYRIAAGCGKKPADVKLMFKVLVMGGESAIDPLAFLEMKAYSIAEKIERETGESCGPMEVLSLLESMRQFGKDSKAEQIMTGLQNTHPAKLLRRLEMADGALRHA